MESKKIKGWTEAEANFRIQLRKAAQNPFAAVNAVERVEFDPLWKEWVIITEYGDTPVMMSRKPRQGLKQNWRVKPLEQAK